MSSMDEILRRSLLFDFYGELLTDHQRNIYEAFDSEDMSLGEIAQQEGISRQGVHDLIRRTNGILEKYESKLHLVERFMQMQEQVGQIRSLAGQLKEGEKELNQQRIDRIISLTDELIDEM